MAKLNKAQIVAALGALAVSVVADQSGVQYMPKLVADQLAAKGYIEINPDPSTVAQNGEVLTRITDAGRNQLPKPAAPKEDKPAFEFVTGLAIPEKVHVGGGRPAENKYPFDAMPVGAGFFVANRAAVVGEDGKETAAAYDAVKSMASTVTSANNRYSKDDPSGATRTNRKGNTVPVQVSERRYEIRRVNDGKAAGFGDRFSGIAGAGIYRVK